MLNYQRVRHVTTNGWDLSSFQRFHQRISAKAICSNSGTSSDDHGFNMIQLWLPNQAWNLASMRTRGTSSNRIFGLDSNSEAFWNPDGVLGRQWCFWTALVWLYSCAVPRITLPRYPQRGLSNHWCPHRAAPANCLSCTVSIRSCKNLGCPMKPVHNKTNLVGHHMFL